MVSEAKKKAVIKYKAKFERIEIRVPEGTREAIKKVSDGASLNVFISEAIEEKINREANV